MPKLVKITLNLAPKACDALDRGCKQSGMTKTDFINRAVQLYDFWLQQEANGRTIWVRDSNSLVQIKML